MSPLKRRKRRDARKKASRARSERHVRRGKKKPHWPRLGDLLDLVEIARGTVPVADAAAEGRAGKEAAGGEIPRYLWHARPSMAFPDQGRR